MIGARSVAVASEGNRGKVQRSCQWTAEEVLGNQYTSAAIPPTRNKHAIGEERKRGMANIMGGMRPV